MCRHVKDGINGRLQQRTIFFENSLDESVVVSCLAILELHEQFDCRVNQLGNYSRFWISLQIH